MRVLNDVKRKIIQSTYVGKDGHGMARYLRAAVSSGVQMALFVKRTT
jgi:hypothetical protein